MGGEGHGSAGGNGLYLKAGAFKGLRAQAPVEAQRNDPVELLLQREVEVAHNGVGRPL
jgi:hypothetical protein